LHSAWLRVWKLGHDDQWNHLGSMRVPGHAYFTVELGLPQAYRVASYSVNGMASDPGPPVTASVSQTRRDLIVGKGFEKQVQ